MKLTKAQSLALAIGFLLIALCAAVARAFGGDPLLGAELGLAAAVGAWLALLARRTGPAMAGNRRLERYAIRASLHDHEVRLVPGAERPEAFVVGPLRPTVFVSRALVDILDRSELKAVLLHEEHHRRTRAPLRAMALASLDQLLGWIAPVARWIERRLAHLEIEADDYAMDAGASAATLASALIKCDVAERDAAMAFSSSAEVRLRRLVGATESPAALRAPIEWLAPMLPTLGVAACHLGQFA